jgi:CRISPR/Cas system CMR subunit Cmr4 (Cas7 group RAMP superfamily)
MQEKNEKGKTSQKELLAETQQNLFENNKIIEALVECVKHLSHVKDDEELESFKSIPDARKRVRLNNLLIKQIRDNGGN